MNGICGAAALCAVGSLGYIALQNRAPSGTWYVSPPRSDYQEARRDGYTAMRVGNLAVAESAFQRAVDTRPSSPGPRLELARVYIAQNERQKAWTTYRSFAKDDLQHRRRPIGESDTLAWYGDLCLEFGSPAEAEQCFTWADADPGLPLRERAALAHVNAGRLLSSTGQAARLHHLRRAFQLAPTSLPVRLGLAQGLLASDERAEAVSLLLASKPLASPKRAVEYASLAFLFDRIGRKDEALAMYRAAKVYERPVDRLPMQEIAVDLGLAPPTRMFGPGGPSGPAGFASAHSSGRIPF